MAVKLQIRQKVTLKRLENIFYWGNHIIAYVFVRFRSFTESNIRIYSYKNIYFGRKALQKSGNSGDFPLVSVL
jgi:hypothetical protein